jgi:hypothetical protein
MKRIALLLVAGTFATGCERSQDAPTSPTVKVPTFVLFGSVRDSSGAPIFGAVAQVTTGPFFGLSAVTNAEGNFVFKNVRGPLTIRVSRDDYEITDKTIDVTSDASIQIVIGKAFYSDTIQFGRTIRSNVYGNASPCDPVSSEPRDGLLVLIAGVAVGKTYEVRVNSYYGSQTFELRAEFQKQ